MTKKILSVNVNGKEYNVEVQDIYASPLEMEIDGLTYTVAVEDTTPTVVVEAPVTAAVNKPKAAKPKPKAPAIPSASSGGAGDVRSPMPGVILDIAVHIGDTVKKGDPLCALEAMKMKSAIRAPKDGTVSKVEVQNGAKVNHNDLLMVIS